MEPLEPELGPFATLYEEWTSVWPEPRNPDIEARLAAMQRDAWASGDPLEQLYVVYFMLQHRDPSDTDLLLEAVRSPDARVADHACATASVWLSLYGLIQHTEEVVDAFRTAALQHPARDLERFAGFRRDDGWPEGHPFIQRYERWMRDEYPRDAAIEQELSALVPEVWANGDALDQAYVLNFLSRSRRLDANLNLIIEGLRAGDVRLARTAAFYASCAIHDGADLGPGIRSILEDYRERFAEVLGPGWYALSELDNPEPRSPGPGPADTP